MTAPVFRCIQPELTHALRHAVLRPHQRLDEMVYEGDDLPSTIHLGAFCATDPDHPVGIATLSDAPMPGGPQAGDYRLRGMAVHPAAQGAGVGRLLVEKAMDELAQRGARRLWCNARVSATGFYERLGFVAHGDAFEIAGIGPHFVMSAAVI